MCEGRKTKNRKMEKINGVGRKEEERMIKEKHDNELKTKEE